MASAKLFLVAIIGFLVATDAPLRIGKMQTTYCIDAESIGMILENTSKAPLVCSVSIEKQDDNGRWLEYSPDIFSRESYPLKVVTIALSGGETRKIEWHPKETGNQHRLLGGNYRVVVNALARSKPAGKQYILGHFSVAKSACHGSNE
jgi:hypothetical protein